jgi:polyisoprenoid-binding protein YceI
MKALIALSCALFLGTPALHAEPVDTRASRIDFYSKQMGVTMPGQLARFSGDIRFSESQPETSSASLDAELASIDAGLPEANQELQGPAWFDTRRYPKAQFISEKVRPVTGNRYEIAGKMTLKGKTRPLTVPVSVNRVSGGMQFTGAFTLKRSDFGIGGGEWADPSVVADEVEVRFSLFVPKK